MSDSESTLGILGEVTRGASLPLFFVSLPALTATAVISAATEPYGKVIGLVFGTWPLLVAVTILGLLFLQDKFRFMGLGELVLTVGASIVAPYLIAYFFGAVGEVAMLHGENASFVQLLHPVHLIYFAGNVLLYYASGLGLLRLVQAVVFGAYLAWALHYKLLPYARRRQEARKEAASKKS